jgi:hypothetical protein
MSESGRQLKTEGKWHKIYSTPTHPRIYESKFASGDARISVSELRQIWEHWHEGERIEFAQAYGQKRTLSSEDEGILEFLIRQSDGRIAASVALLTTKHPNKKMVTDFLRRSITAFPDDRANFVHALAYVIAPDAAPDLLRVFQECQTRVTENEQNHQAIIELLYCSTALFTIFLDEKYQNVVAAFLNHPAASVRTNAEICIQETRVSSGGQ